MTLDPTRAFVRHTIATLAYRGAKVLRGAPADFAGVRAGDPERSSRTAIEILAHIGDLLDWTARLVSGEQGWQACPAQSWDHEVGRFFDGLSRVDAALLSDSTPSITLERIFQGPIADALTHFGQLALLRGIAGSPVHGEVLILSEIEPGRLGPDQAPPVREFD